MEFRRVLFRSAAEPERLAEGQPALAGEATLDDGAPEDQDVDPGVAPLGRGTLRHGERRLGFRGAPRLYPGNAAGLQLGDDLVGDFLIEARPVVTGTGASGGSGHRGSPRRAPGASLPILNPSRNPVRTLTLRSHEGGRRPPPPHDPRARSEEHTSELQSLMRISYAVFCLK